ncbi:hypothetical protein OHA57_40040 (plasmid) [Streptomyces anulatus]|uniref:hypothetical protein n=1 Tax=Streptomyces anulatus TaxID=1892 RepID=UPI002DD8A6D8|nr:hypothetical protein [Streptomyces anulatus]WSC66930.1 hypothetical protein OHA57_40040 [Streptomyces anulatus]
METEVIVALIGVSATVTAAAIAYPVGRGVARRQASDQHIQWLRAQRQNASARLAGAATDFIETVAHAWEAVARPEYAHTRRRDIESRKRLDPALYEPLRQALREMHNALPAVDLHGPDDITVAGQQLHTAAMDMAGAVLQLDAMCVQRSVLSGAFQTAVSQGLSGQRIEASLDDLDTAYTRLAAPLGFPEFTARAEETLRLSSVMVDMLRLTSSLDDPPAARAALADLRRAAADDAEMRHHIEPFLSLEAVVEMRVLAQTLDEGQEIGPDQQLASVSAALTAMIGMLTHAQQTSQNPLPDGLDTDGLPPEFISALASFSASGDVEGSLNLLQQMQQHLFLGDELAATATDPATASFAGLSWNSHLAALGTRLSEEATVLNAFTPQIPALIEPIFEFSQQRLNDHVRARQAHLVQSRIDFLDIARRNITT